MHKDFYASGFLYHLPTQQILLQQHKDTHTDLFTWSLFGGEIKTTESPQAAFKRIISNTLHIKLKTKSIFDIYEYSDTEIGKNHIILYAELPKLIEFSSQKNTLFTWVQMKQVDKLPIPAQMKQNITVGKRVINARERSLAETQTGDTSLLNEA